MHAALKCIGAELTAFAMLRFAFVNMQNKQIERGF
jgi:hypothetical protein